MPAADYTVSADGSAVLVDTSSRHIALIATDTRGRVLYNCKPWRLTLKDIEKVCKGYSYKKDLHLLAKWTKILVAVLILGVILCVVSLTLGLTLVAGSVLTEVVAFLHIRPGSKLTFDTIDTSLIKLMGVVDKMQPFLGQNENVVRLYKFQGSLAILKVTKTGCNKFSFTFCQKFLTTDVKQRPPPPKPQAILPSPKKLVTAVVDAEKELISKWHQAIQFFLEDKYHDCVETLAQCFELSKFTKKYDVSYLKLMFAVAQTKIGTPCSLQEALDAFRHLQIPEEFDQAVFLWGFCTNLEKMHKFKFGLCLVKKGIQALDVGKPEPVIRKILIGSKSSIQEELERLYKVFAYPPKPAAVCRFSACLDLHLGREIYFSEPDFVGFVVVGCEAGCKVAFHLTCWKLFKESQLPSSLCKVTDKEMLDRDCLTEGCYRVMSPEQRVPHKVTSILITDEQGLEKTRLLSATTTSKRTKVPTLKRIPSTRNKVQKQVKVGDVVTHLPKVKFERIKGGKDFIIFEQVSVGVRKNRGNAWIEDVLEKRRLDSALAPEEILDRIARARSLCKAKNVEVLKISQNNDPSSVPIYRQQLWYMFAINRVANNGGCMSKDQLFECYLMDENSLSDFFLKTRKQPSKTSLLGHLLSSPEFGSIDDLICFSEFVPLAYKMTVHKFDLLHTKLYGILPKEVQDSPQPISLEKANEEAKQKIADLDLQLAKMKTKTEWTQNKLKTAQNEPYESAESVVRQLAEREHLLQNQVAHSATEYAKVLILNVDFLRQEATLSMEAAKLREYLEDCKLKEAAQNHLLTSVFDRNLDLINKQWQQIYHKCREEIFRKRDEACNMLEFVDCKSAPSVVQVAKYVQDLEATLDTLDKADLYLKRQIEVVWLEARGEPSALLSLLNKVDIPEVPLMPEKIFNLNYRL